MFGQINHSCEPNCRVEQWVVAGYSRLMLFAERDISAEEELTWDYTVMPKDVSLQDTVNRDVKDEIDCLCGSTNCRKPKFKWHDPTSCHTAPNRSPFQPPLKHKPNTKYKGTFCSVVEDGISTDNKEKWCICREKDDGNWMVECSGKKCPYQWFHFRCVGLTTEPEETTWYCETCSHMWFFD